MRFTTILLPVLLFLSLAGAGANNGNVVGGGNDSAAGTRTAAFSTYSTVIGSLTTSQLRVAVADFLPSVQGMELWATGSVLGIGDVSVLCDRYGPLGLDDFPGVWGGSVTACEYDNDGIIDVLVTGQRLVDLYTYLYYNVSSFPLVDQQGDFPVPGLHSSCAAWGDCDNDGDQDLLLAGATATASIAGILRNEDGEWSVIDFGISGMMAGSVAWGDYDNDGDLDFLLAGAVGGAVTRVYNNDVGVFTDIEAGLPGVSACSVDWGDYDCDGDLDILLSGESGSSYISRVYRNDSGSFVDATAGLAGVRTGSAAWGDCDNDGDLDILLTGNSGAGIISIVYRNDSGAFTDIGAGLPGVYMGESAWCDFDEDGDLDILLSGDTGTGDICRIYWNDSVDPNTPPSPPTNLSASVVGDDVTFSWAPATDAETPTAGLSYNLRVGTTPGGCEIMSAMSDAATGSRYVVQNGNAQQGTSWTLQIPDGEYYWSVQAVDAGFAGSPFAAEKTIVVADWTPITAMPVGDPGEGHGAAWGDYDGDGWTDLYVANSGDNKLLRNLDGTGFSDETDDVTGGSATDSWAAVFGDYDNDGDLDIYVANGSSQQNVLLRNLQPGTPAWQAISYDPVSDAGSSVGAAWADYDNDGDVDLYVANYGQANLLLENDTYLGQFFDVTSPPLDDAGAGAGVAWGDYDNDGYQDLYLCNYQLNCLFHNEGDGTFTDATTDPLRYAGLSTGVAWGDYDNDGDLDLYIACWGESNKLLRNDGGGVFTDVTDALLGDYFGSYGVAWGDYDNDGHLDLYVVDVGGSNRLFHNEGDGAFIDATDAVICGTGEGAGTAFADYDNDGLLDIYLVNHDGANVLYRNTISNGNHWLHLDLRGTLSNRAAIGARVRCVAGGVSQIREVSGGSGYCSQDSPRVEFGLGSATVVDSIQIVWPYVCETGVFNTTELLDVAVDQILVVEEEPVQICSVSPTELEFGTVYVGRSAEMTFTVANLGCGELTGIIGEDCDHFSIPAGGGSYSLDEGDSLTVAVRFEPTVIGEHVCTVETGTDGCPGVVCTGTAVDCTSAPPVLYVDASAATGGDGTSWPEAYTELRDALAAAATIPCPLEVWVAAGTYTPTDGADRDSTFFMRSGLALYGGFAGDESTREERDFRANPTVLSGEIGDPGSRSDNSYRVVRASGVDSTAVIDGFTVSGSHGGCGMLNIEGSAPRVRNVVFEANDDGLGGGGMRNHASSPSLLNVEFRNNSSRFGDGGGMHNASGSSPLLVNVVFCGNTVDGGWNNYDGGGMANESASNPVLINVTFHGNEADGDGDGIYNDNSWPYLINTIMYGDGDGLEEVYNLNGSIPVIMNSLIMNCMADGGSWDGSLGHDYGGNIDLDPLFVSASEGDLHLTEGSPAIDSGSQGFAVFAEYDLDGNPRVVNEIIDMGAYEYGSDLVSVGEDPGDTAPRAFCLYRARPNPFNPATTIRFDLPEPASVRIDVFDVLGRLVRTLEPGGYYEAGNHEVTWRGRDASGQAVASGAYFCRLMAGGFVQTRRMMLVK